MKHWTSIICLFLAVAAMSWVRRSYRDRVLNWSADRAGATTASGRSRALAVHGLACGCAALVVLFGLWAWNTGGAVEYVRYPAGLLVLVGYVPFAGLAAPKLTKWQKSHEQRLVEAGAARAAAQGWDSVARVFSVLVVLLGLGAVFLLVAPN